ncbi:MAG: hypothetical protein D6731_09150 [Planctomycetota bacterium]|nr:MAG: hypothetical protein D6731_09150 [Planctomycetota bacterium]
MRHAGILCASLFAAAAAHADAPEGWVELGGWTAHGEQRSAGADAALGLDLGNDLRLDLSWTHAAQGARSSLAWGRLTWSWLRLGGGTVDNALAFHLGYAPRGRLAFGERAWLRAGVDAAVGLARFDREGPVVRNGIWSSLPREVDAYATSLAGFVELHAQPFSRLRLGLRGYGDAFLVEAPPRAGDALTDWSGRLDLSLASALSDIALGGAARAELELFRARASGWQLSLSTAYREAWDWIHLDPSTTLFAALDPLDGVRVAPVPWRSTRRASLIVRALRGPDLDLGARVDVQQVEGSTTSLDFADRNGWSLGAGLHVRWGRTRLAVGLRRHTQRSRREELLGRLPRTAVWASGSWTLFEDDSARIALVGAGRWTVHDAYGLPTRGHAVAAALRVEFGGPRERPWIPREPWQVSWRAAPRSSTNHRASPAKDRATARRPVPIAQALSKLGAKPRIADFSEVAQRLPKGAGLRLEPEAAEELLAEAERSLGLDAESLALLARGTAAERLDTALRLLRPTLGLAHGRSGSRVGWVDRRARRFALTERVDRASLAAVTQRFDPPEELRGLLAGPRLLDDFLAEARAEAFSLYQVHGDELRLVLQGRSAWARQLRFLLSGR